MNSGQDMNTSSKSNGVSRPTRAWEVRGPLLRRKRTFLVVLAVAAVGAGFALNWESLVSAGIAPLLLALAPCAAMCALGLCMGKNEKGECSEQGKSR